MTWPHESRGCPRVARDAASTERRASASAVEVLLRRPAPASSKRSSCALTASGRAGPIALSTPRRGRSSCGMQLAHLGRGLLRLQRGVAPFQHRLRLLEQRGPAALAAQHARDSATTAAPRRTCPHRSRRYAFEPRARGRQRVERRRGAAHGRAGLQRDVLRQRRECSATARAAAPAAASPARDSDQRQRGQQRRRRAPRRAAAARNRAASGSIGHVVTCHIVQLGLRGLRTPPPAGTRALEQRAQAQHRPHFGAALNAPAR